MNFDRLKESFAAAAKAQFPAIDFLSDYSGKVVSQGGENAFDFQPDDPRIPSMSGIPAKLPFPGFSLQLDPSASPRANIGWANGDPSRPEIRLWEKPGLAQVTVAAGQVANLQAPAVNLGSGAAQPLVMGQVYRAAEDAWFSGLAGVLAACGAAAQAAGADPVLNGVAPVASNSFKAMGAALNSVAALLATFEGAAPTYLSQVSKTA